MEEIKDLSIQESVMDAKLSEDGIVTLTLSGNISSDMHGEALREWVEKAKVLILERKRINNGKCVSIADIGSLKNFDDGSISIINTLAGWPEAYNVKSAVVGANMITKMALRTVVIMTGRTNLKAFDKKEDAIAWLKEESV